MDKARWKELAEQALTGFIYGFAAAIVTTNAWDQAALIGLLVGAVKGAAHATIKLLAPPEVNAGVKFRKMHWTERIDRIL